MQGTIYLLHFDGDHPGRARHYIGWTVNLRRRLAAHASGRGAKLLRALREVGGTFHLAASWPGTREEERRLHQRHQHARLCPDCRRLALSIHAAHERTARAAGRRRRRRGRIAS